MDNNLSQLFNGNVPHGMEKLSLPYNFRAVIPGAHASPYTGPRDVYGYVDQASAPSRMMINRLSQLTEAPHILSHEFEHVLQNNVEKRYGRSWDRDVLNTLANRYLTKYGEKGKSKYIAKDDLISSLENSASNKQIPDYFKKTYNHPIKYFGGMQPGEFSLREQWAEISAAEQQLKKDLTKDPFVRQHVFGNNQDIIDVYKATTGLRTNRMDSKDLPPMTP
jgi:hypothetical protein